MTISVVPATQSGRRDCDIQFVSKALALLVAPQPDATHTNTSGDIAIRYQRVSPITCHDTGREPAASTAPV